MSVTVRVLCSPLEHEEGRSSPQSGRANGLTLKGRMAQIVNGKLMLVEAASSIDGVENEVAQDTQKAINEPSYASQSPLNEAVEDAPTASTSRLSTPTTSSKARPKAVRRQTRYFCTWEGCCKSYAKPVRLAEHMRSHTGERPFECTHEGCNASYLRDTHLVAHMRTHLDEKDKPFTCEEDECGKKFWTNQHLNRHVKLVHEQDAGAYKVRQPRSFYSVHRFTDLLFLFCSVSDVTLPSTSTTSSGSMLQKTTCQKEPSLSYVQKKDAANLFVQDLNYVHTQKSTMRIATSVCILPILGKLHLPLPFSIIQVQRTMQATKKKKRKLTETTVHHLSRSSQLGLPCKNITSLNIHLLVLILNVEAERLRAARS